MVSWHIDIVYPDNLDRGWSNCVRMMNVLSHVSQRLMLKARDSLMFVNSGVLLLITDIITRFFGFFFLLLELRGQTQPLTSNLQLCSFSN